MSETWEIAAAAAAVEHLKRLTGQRRKNFGCC